MFAIIKTGGKQYRVTPGDTIFVEKLLGNAGDAITLSEVLMVNHDDKIDLGTPFVSGATVRAIILEQKRGDKIIVFKKKRRQGYRRKKGHRQEITVLKIEAIDVNGTNSVNDVSSSLTLAETRTPNIQALTDSAVTSADTNLISSSMDTPSVSVTKKASTKKSINPATVDAIPTTDNQSKAAPKAKINKNVVTSSNDGTGQTVVKKSRAKAQQEAKE